MALPADAVTTPSRTERAVQMVRKGASYSAAAAAVGVSYSAVQSVCSHRGIRSPWQAGSGRQSSGNSVGRAEAILRDWRRQHERAMDDEPLATECYESSLAGVVVPVRPTRPAPEHVCATCGHAASRETLRVQRPGEPAVERKILRCLNRKRRMEAGMPIRDLLCGRVEVLEERPTDGLILAPPAAPAGRY